MYAHQTCTKVYSYFLYSLVMSSMGITHALHKVWKDWDQKSYWMCVNMHRNEVCMTMYGLPVHWPFRCENHKILGPSPLGNNYYRWDVAIDVSTVEEAIMSNQKVIYMFIISYDSHSIKVYHPFIKNTSVSIWWMCISALQHYHGKYGIVCFSRLLKTWQEFLSPCEVG